MRTLDPGHTGNGAKIGNLRFGDQHPNRIHQSGHAPDYPCPVRRELGFNRILLGADPKRVTELFFDPVKKANPEFSETYLANGELALAKAAAKSGIPLTLSTASMTAMV